MNHLLLQRLEPLMQKSGGQLATMLTGAITLIALVIYQWLFRSIWLQQTELEQQINESRQVVTHAQVALLRGAPLSRLQHMLKENSVVENDILPLDQQFAPPLKASQTALVRWSPAPDGQGELQLHGSFGALMHFLQVLQQRQWHPAYSDLNFHATENGLAVSLLLTQTNEAADGGEVTLPVRDPFAPLQSQSCGGETLAPAWSLGGITQSEGQQFGWLLSPDGRWNKVETGTQIGTPLWTVALLDASQVELSISDARCGEQRQTLRFGHSTISPENGKQ
ncbi:pilus assembly protein PilO [Enterobacteriaceae bacterium Kacie_13]|nr:pilus assembly protein PilO [Enterobacteriaceae bacterium Kacie_13]